MISPSWWSYLADRDCYLEKRTFQINESRKTIEDRGGKLYVQAPSLDMLLPRVEDRVLSSTSHRPDLTSRGHPVIAGPTSHRPDLDLMSHQPEGAIASYTRHIFVTSEDVVKTHLKDRGVRDIDRTIEKNSFYTISFSLVIEMENPVKSFLQYAKFTFRFDNDVKILKIVPESQGIKIDVEKTITRDIKITPSLTIESPIPEVGTVTAKPLGEYDSKNGWTYTIPIYIEEVKGYTREYNGTSEVNWDIYGQGETQGPNDKIGETIVVPAIVTLQVPKETIVTGQAFVDGKIRREGKYWIFDGTEPIELVNPKWFEVKEGD